MSRNLMWYCRYLLWGLTVIAAAAAAGRGESCGQPLYLSKDFHCPLDFYSPANGSSATHSTPSATTENWLSPSPASNSTLSPASSENSSDANGTAKITANTTASPIVSASKKSSAGHSTSPTDPSKLEISTTKTSDGGRKVTKFTATSPISKEKVSRTATIAPATISTGSATEPTTTLTWTSTTTDSSMPPSWITSTTDYANAKPKPISTTSLPPSEWRTTTAKTDEPTTHVQCERTCPEWYFAGKNGCYMLQSARGRYSVELGQCQGLDKGDMISARDIQTDFEAISELMKYYDLPQYKFFLNAYQSNLVRKEKSVQVVYISSNTVALTHNDSIVPRGAEMEGVGTICKIPKNCLQWTCPTSYALQDAPDMEYDTPLPRPTINFQEQLKYRCKNQSISTKRWEAHCTHRGSIGPPASIYNAWCLPDENAMPVRGPESIIDRPIANLSCDMCTQMGTARCEKIPGSESHRCVCREGWTGNTCWRFPKFCPNMSCPQDSVCQEMVDHAACVCTTERCVVLQRSLNRSEEMQFLDTAVTFAGPSFDFFVKMVIQVLFPEKGNTVQESLQYFRATFGSCAGVVYMFGGNPQTLKIDIAERRAMSLMFHFPQILVHLLYALEVAHIDAVMRGTSDGKWRSRQIKDKTRWDYGWTYFVSITLGLAFSMGIWYTNWDTHQTEFTSLGVWDTNFGMLGWTAAAYCLCATYSFWKCMDIILDPNRRRHEVVKRDNKYETCYDPRLQENEDQCWRNIGWCMVGAPIQCLYSISMIANLAWDNREIKYINLCLVFLNSVVSVMQSIQCDRKFLGKIRGWKMMRKPLEERFNKYDYRTTSETIAARKGRAAYEDMLQKRREAEEKKREKKREENQEQKRILEEKGIPAKFHPHFPLEGPPPCKVFEYDPCEKHYMCEREREWKFVLWTNEYLGARVKVGVTVSDAIQHVKNGLLDSRFLHGDECPRTQALTMFQEWMDMMLVQDRIDFARPTHTERRFLKNLVKKGVMADLAGLSVANRVRDAPIDPKKRRLLEPAVEIFAYSAPERMEIGRGLCKDEFGMLWVEKIIKDMPCITRAQEEKVWKAICNDRRKGNIRFDQIYTDDEKYNALKGKPYEAALKEHYKVKEAYPEGRKKKSLNPRFAPIDITYMDQMMPDFIGPRQPHYQIPAGPLLRRFFCEVIYKERRDLVFDLLAEQAAKRRQNSWIRWFIRANR